jgi:hypothetical protein
LFVSVGTKHNIGSADRVVRLSAGAVLALVGVASIGGVLGLGSIAGAIAVLLATALTRSCPLFHLLGMILTDIDTWITIRATDTTEDREEPDAVR